MSIQSDVKHTIRKKIANITKDKVYKPPLYRVLLLNDDITPMDFVVYVLEYFFHKNKEEATRIMLQVHHESIGVCGIYPYEIAEEKVTRVTEYSKSHEYPLQCILEKE